MTIREKLVKALIAFGEKEVPSASKKYLRFTRSKRPGTFYFIGKSGSLRFGRTSTGSLAVSDAAKASLIERFCQ